MNGSEHITILAIYSAAIFLAPFLLRTNHGRSSIQDTVNAMGILGTFVGIAWGLIHLDFQNLQAGIPVLIRYLSFGFGASIAGFIASLVVKHTDIYGIKEGTKDASEKELLEEIKEELKRVNTNLSGEGETTLVTQIQKMRTSTADGLDELNQSFAEFAKNVAENNSKALIEALEGVMRDFNTKINEQFLHLNYQASHWAIAQRPCRLHQSMLKNSAYSQQSYGKSSRLWGNSLVELRQYLKHFPVVVKKSSMRWTS